MKIIEVKTNVDQETWLELEALAKESNQSMARVLTEAIRDYVQMHRVRPEVLTRLKDSMNANEELNI